MLSNGNENRFFNPIMGIELSQPMYKPYMWLHELALSGRLQKDMSHTSYIYTKAAKKHDY